MPRDDELVKTPECRALRAKVAPMLLMMDLQLASAKPNLPSYVQDGITEAIAILKRAVDRWGEHEKAA